jgi:tRNA (guanine37-N1)-methyltransferase
MGNPAGTHGFGGESCFCLGVVLKFFQIGHQVRAMRFDVFTLFPAIFESPLKESILKRAQEMGQLTVALHNIRDYATGKHRITDDYPYGGGGGMVMKPEPIFAAVEAVLGTDLPQTPVILTSPQGRPFDQQVAWELAANKRLAVVCGRYEGVDERVRQLLVTDEISIGDYVLTGGELPALVLIDAITRLLPGVLGDAGATLDDSHADGLLEGPHYTRPPEFRGRAVPDVLVSGHHAEIARWRRHESLRRTWKRRPELLQQANLTPMDRQFLAELVASQNGDGGSERKPD